MPANNAFHHQCYASEPPTASWHLIRAREPPEPGSADYERAMARAGETYRAAGVRAIWLVHGTFAGDDAMGLIRLMERVMPASARRLRQLHKGAFDTLAQDCGNYTAQTAAELERGTQLPVDRVTWSSENHHLARAHAAVCLIDRLAKSYHPQDRILIWGHSHAGNVLALVSNLLAADAGQSQAFFSAANCFYRRRWGGPLDVPVWGRVQELLDRSSSSRRWPQLDFVTFGTPIRYGWDTQGYAKLLHFVYHRPRPGIPEYLTCLPQTAEDVFHARDGDYVQQLGIAGTNLAPPVVAWRTWLADLRLGRLLQRGIRPHGLLRRLRLGQRVPQEGETLLVEYPDGPAVRQLAGHAVYTRQSWLPYHALEVARRLYAAGD